jgi:hypothetical protein
MIITSRKPRFKEGDYITVVLKGKLYAGIILEDAHKHPVSNKDRYPVFLYWVYDNLEGYGGEPFELEFNMTDSPAAYLANSIFPTPDYLRRFSQTINITITDREEYKVLKTSLISKRVNSAYKDLLEKARRLKVVTESVDPDHILCYVDGDNGTYECLLEYNLPGGYRKNWSCTCDWGEFRDTGVAEQVYGSNEGVDRPCSHCMASNFQHMSEMMSK